MRIIRTILTALFLGMLCHGISAAQVIINDYTRVRSINRVNCRSIVTVDSLVSLSVGDRVLLIQTGGCTSSAGYDVTSVGLCEFNTIASISGTTIELAFSLVHTYDTCGTIQLIRVPEYSNHTISQEITGRAWNGRVGGVVVIDVRGTLTLGAGITADGLGFRGGATWPGGGDCSSLVDDDVVNSPVGAAKGETYVSPLPTMVAGGRALFSGGGGGRGHNSGGGGGGNGGSGGRGGSQWQGCGSFFDNGGRPGDSAAVQWNGYPTLRMGGGGGAGHMNNNSGTSGARGGGIIIVRCDTIIGNQHTISASGLAPQVLGGNDGAGGGGAGGAIYLQTQVVLGAVSLRARGGAGGNMNNGGLHGPGGGGGGGCLSFAQSVLPPTISIDLVGGSNGRNVAIADPRNSQYLADSGRPGTIGLAAIIPESRITPVIPIVKAIDDTTLCLNDSITLDCVLSDAADSVRWFDTRGRLIGTTKRVALRAIRTDTYIVQAYGALGCFNADTVVITIRPPWNVHVDSLHLGTIRCDRVIDTTIVIRNRGSSTALLSSITDSTSLARWLTELPDSIGAGESIAARIRVVPDGRQGAGSAVLRLQLSPCDSTISSVITWQRADRVIDLKPDTVLMPVVEVCTSESSDLEVDLVFSGADVVVEEILPDPIASALLNAPFAAANGQAIRTVLTWTPTRTSTVGRIGFVVRDSGCVDTLWLTVTGTVRAPFLIAPDVVQADTMILCRDSNVVIRIPVIADTTTPWIIDSIEWSGPGSVASRRGDTVRGADTLIIVALPTIEGIYEITARIRLVPCDTVITLRVQGLAVNVSLQGTPRLDYTEQYIGRSQVLQATFTNTGTASAVVQAVRAPSAPFRILRIQPPLPVRLLPGEGINIDVEYLQTYGSWADSIVLETTNPCVMSVVTQLQGVGSATTRVRIPDVRGTAGETVHVPVLLDGRPNIEPSLLDSFAVRFAWRTSEAFVREGTTAQASWQVEQIGDSSHVRLQGQWSGTDTLASIPMLMLLSIAESTNVVFDRVGGFVWRGQQSDVEYDDGLLIIDDVCSGRRLRSIKIGAFTRPSVVPIPASESITITTPTRNGSVTAQVLNLLGAILLDQQFSAVDSGSVVLHVGNLPTGLHILRIESEFGSTDLPLVIHR